MRLKDKVAIVVGAGQSPGEGMGNGRATALTFAREGAKVLCVDHHLESAQETAAMIAAKHGTAAAFRADVTKIADIKAMAAKEVIPIMRAQGSGVIINISSMAAITTYPYVAYKATKSAMIAFTEQLAYQNAEYGIRANVILPGLMNTPMAVDTRAREWHKTRAEVEAERDSKVPLRRKMGTGCDVAGGWRSECETGVSDASLVLLSFSPCGRSWREAPDEGLHPRTQLAKR